MSQPILEAAFFPVGDVGGVEIDLKRVEMIDDGGAGGPIGEHAIEGIALLDGELGDFAVATAVGLRVKGRKGGVWRTHGGGRLGGYKVTLLHGGSTNGADCWVKGLRSWGGRLHRTQSGGAKRRDEVADDMWVVHVADHGGWWRIAADHGGGRREAVKPKLQAPSCKIQRSIKDQAPVRKLLEFGRVYSVLVE